MATTDSSEPTFNTDGSPMPNGRDGVDIFGCPFEVSHDSGCDSWSSSSTFDSSSSFSSSSFDSLSSSGPFSSDPDQRQDFRPPALCIDPGKETLVSFSLDLSQLFPTQKMFNVRWAGDEPELTDKGIGNWIALSLPVTVGSKAHVMGVRLTAVDSKARISIY
jgi:hypothetical protein